MKTYQQALTLLTCVGAGTLLAACTAAQGATSGPVSTVGDGAVITSSDAPHPVLAAF